MAVLTKHRYWRVINLAESGAAAVQIVDKIMIATNSRAVARVSITHIVEAILENLLLVLASGADPGSPGLKRGSILANFQKPRPISISTYRNSYAPQQDQLVDSEAKLRAAQRQEDRLITEALKLTGQRESMRMRPDSEEKRQQEAALDLETRRTLRKHHTIEHDVDQARALVDIIHKLPPLDHDFSP